MAGCHNRLFILNPDEFFTGLLDVFSQSAEDGASGDAAEYFSRRLEEYQRTIRVRYGTRLREHRLNSTDQLMEDMEQLINVIGQRIERLEALYSDRHFNEQDYTDESNRLPIALGAENRNGCVGRPRIEITQEQIQILRNNLGFKWIDIARMFGVSSRTLIRRREELGMPLGHESNFSALSDHELDMLVREILSVTPQSGVGLVQGALRSRGLRIQRHRVIESLRRLDPITSALRQSRRIIRRTYSVPGPNSLW